MANRRRALLVAPEAPYPLVGGGALRAASMLEYLAQSHIVDAIVFHTPGSPVAFPPGLVDRLDTIELPAHSKHYAARALRNGHRMLRRSPPLVDRFAGFGAGIATLLADRPFYDLAVLEHFWCAPYHEQIAPRARWTILDLHNIESAWHLGCGKVAGWPQSAAHEVFHQAAINLERQWLPLYSLVLAASADDAARVQSIAPEAAVAVYPNTIPRVDYPPRREQDTIVFSGTLEYEPNRTAVRHFAAEIWPTLRHRWPGLKWRLVGRNPEAIRSYIAGDPTIECTGPVDNAICELARAKVIVVPLLSGSGTRLKIIEAWAAGAPVVSTPVGAEGLPARHGENILLADDPASFADSVSCLLASPADRDRIGRRGREQYESELTWETAWKALDQALRSLLKS
jgi:glycosyltransferase involved in cell wall biosynthesis